MTGFDLRRPCAPGSSGVPCPFLRSCPRGWLSRRAEEIADGLRSDRTFSCHKTVELDEDGSESVNLAAEQHCAGALIVLEKGGEPWPQLARISERLGLFDPGELDMDADTFDDLDEFVEHHAAEPEER
jgi:hypothetical protein